MPDLPAAGETIACGDLALTFGDRRPTRSRSGSTWAPLTDGEGWCLWATEPTAGWRGHRLHRHADPDDLLLTLGRRPDHWLGLRRIDADGTWVVRTDRFATVHAYAGDGIVTTFSPAAWGTDPPLDWGAIGGFVRLGWYPADRMPVTGVRLLRPATDERWRADGTHEAARRWQGWQPDADPNRSVADAADDFGRVLDEVLDEQAAAGRIGLPISGGLDSRVTVASLTRAGAPDRDLWAYSYGYAADSPELRIAGEVATARDLALHAHVVHPYLFTALDDVVDATEGLVDLTLCRQSSVVDQLAEHTEAVVAAHWGDVWFGASPPAPGTSAADALFAASTKRGHQWLTDHVVRPHLGRDPEPELRDLLATEAAALAHLDDPTLQLLALKTEQWSLRWTEATLRAFQAGTEPRLPFYDPRMADFALSLPADLLGGRRVQIEYLRRHAPDLARVEWQAVETDLFGLRHERTWRLPRRALRRIARRVRPPTARLRNWEVQLLEPAGRTGVDRLLTEPGAAIHDLVDRADVVALVDQHRAQPTDPGLGYAVSALLTLAAWTERFT